MAEQTLNDAARTADAPGGAPIGHFIDGRLVTPEGARTGEVFDPGQGRAVTEVALADAATVDAAVQAAARAFPAWRDLALSRRMPIMYRFRDALIAHADELA